MEKPQIVAVFPDIRSIYNVGSFFRTADALGLDHLYLSGVTPTPRDRFGRERSDLAKTALGAEKNISWSYHKNTTSLLRRLRQLGFFLVAIEQDKNSVDYKTFKIPRGISKVAFICGEEVAGLPQSLLKKTDMTLEIKMSGKKESLNVSVAFAVVLFRILNR